MISKTKRSPLDLYGYEAKTREAIMAFWGNREKAAKKQKELGRADQGERAGVTGGKNMDGFLALVLNVVQANGLSHATIHLTKGVLTLPGFFRPTKLWDILIMDKGELIAAIELKSHVGPSFGKNYNNRTEESIGTAHDMWTAYREGAFGKQPRPFLGWLILVEDCPKSRNPVRNTSKHFAVSPAFKGASYLKRYEILCERLVSENLYATATVLGSPRDAVNTGKYVEMSELTGMKAFLSALAGHAATQATRLE